MSQNFLVSRETGAGESGDLARNKSDEAPWHPAGSRAAAWWCQQKLIRVWWLWWLAHKEFVTNSSPQQWIERERDAICSFHVVLLIYWQWKIFIWFPTFNEKETNWLASLTIFTNEFLISINQPQQFGFFYEISMPRLSDFNLYCD